jgi:act minimal PKS acyl carrier protein
MDRTFAFEDLRRILQAAAGESEALELAGDSLDQAFQDLGYDSIALLETVGRIEDEIGVKLADDIVTETLTPRALVEVVNSRIAPGDAHT